MGTLLENVIIITGGGPRKCSRHRSKKATHELICLLYIILYINRENNFYVI